MQKLIDANVILRYLLEDNELMSAEARKIIEEDGAFTTPEVLAEVAYVLKGVYKAERTDISAALTTALTQVHIEHPEVYRRAFGIYAACSLDFVDCILIARHQMLGDEVFSFDRKLKRNLETAAGL